MVRTHTYLAALARIQFSFFLGIAKKTLLDLISCIYVKGCERLN